MVKDGQIMRYNGMTLEQLSSLSENQLLDIAYDMLRWCNHTVRGMSEDIRATLAKCDAMDKVAGLYCQVKQTNYQ